MGKILVVDDDPQLRQSFEKLLTAEGHTVRTAASGESAVIGFRMPVAIGPSRGK